MGLREEIQHLIAAERQKLEAADGRKNEYWHEEEMHFAGLKSLLEQMIAAFDPAYVKAEIQAYTANISVGWNAPENGSFETKIQWKIAPHSALKFDVVAGESWREFSPEFDVEETSYLAYELHQNKRLFANEQELLEYLTRSIAQQVAGFEHVNAKALSRRPAKSNET